ncbi:potassium voltage-gated channel subfamily C member 1 [Elysia marginata]|uniref:Potassium voltage-gated channel subfamily C member 1 n=1 Tax=Elysia marginata TaxID=1093978 RepID=A0AAV4JV86_9GAST|nr:potassium voltage-gated channel subfamily C member 1 [Elysia marginata]
MSAKVRNKLKGMIFSDRPARPPGSPLASSREDSRAGLISHTKREGGPLSETDQEESDDAKEEPNTHVGRVAHHRDNHDDFSSRDKPRLQWQRSLRERVLDGPRRPHDSTSHVHVTDGSCGEEEPTRHYMQSQNNTPLRQLDRRSSALDDDDDQRLLINVGGVRHETHVATLRNVPSSRLSRLAEWHVSSGGGRLEYFFDRHPAVFNSIIDFYRTGELHVPLEVCGAVVKRELNFWQIEEYQIKVRYLLHCRTV